MVAETNIARAGRPLGYPRVVVRQTHGRACRRGGDAERSGDEEPPSFTHEQASALHVRPVAVPTTLLGASTSRHPRDRTDDEEHHRDDEEPLQAFDEQADASDEEGQDEQDDDERHDPVLSVAYHRLTRA